MMLKYSLYFAVINRLKLYAIFALCVLQMLQEFNDDLVPLIIPAKRGGTQLVRVVLTSSEEDKELLQVVSQFQFLVINHGRSSSKLHQMML